MHQGLVIWVYPESRDYINIQQPNAIFLKNMTSFHQNKVGKCRERTLGAQLLLFLFLTPMNTPKWPKLHCWKPALWSQLSTAILILENNKSMISKNDCFTSSCDLPFFPISLYFTIKLVKESKFCPEFWESCSLLNKVDKILWWDGNLPVCTI